jgi:hypothetical protein
LSKEALELTWHSRLLRDCCEQNLQKRQSIIRWLLGENLERFDRLTPRQLAIAAQVMDYRYQILRQRYLGVEPTQAYCNLINRLGSLMLLCSKIRTWVALSQERKQAILTLIQAATEEMLNSDRALQQQIVWIAQCTQDSHLRNALLLSSLEEYCLRSIRHQPLLAEKIASFLQSRYFIVPQGAIEQKAG